jgi:putative membrane protein
LNFASNRSPAALVATGTALILAVAGFCAKILADWWLENIVIAAFFGVLAFAPRVRALLTPTAVWMLFALLCLHEYGAAYAYATPLGDWMRTNTPGFEARNHYDRLVHFLYGLLTFRAFREAAGGSTLAAVQSVLSTSALYEIDDFDAAKDMALAFCGSVLATVFLQVWPASTKP